MPSIPKRETPSSFHGEPIQRKPACKRFKQRVLALELPFAMFMCEAHFLVNPFYGRLKVGMPVRQP